MPILPKTTSFVQRLFAAGALVLSTLTPALAHEPFTPGTVQHLSPIQDPAPQPYRLWQRPALVTCEAATCTEQTGPYVPYSRYASADDCHAAVQDLQLVLRDAGASAGGTQETHYTTTLLCVPEALTPLAPVPACPLPPMQPAPVPVDAVPVGQ